MGREGGTAEGEGESKGDAQIMSIKGIVTRTDESTLATPAAAETR